MRVTLHTHCADGSGDSRTPPSIMADAAWREGMYLTALVGHNERPAPMPNHDHVITGIEHGEGSGDIEPHVVELGNGDFTFLAHPRATWPENTKARALEYVREHDLDGVEKYNAGMQQYTGSLPVPELANDDAHNTRMLGTSFMRVPTDELTVSAVFDAIRREDHEIVNRGRSLTGVAIKGYDVAVTRTIDRITGREPA